MDTPLAPGHEVRCPHCGRWHPIVAKHATGTDYTVRMLYWECRGGYYYAGQIGHTARFPTRQRSS
jgi:hypothetical protein